MFPHKLFAFLKRDFLIEKSYKLAFLFRILMPLTIVFTFYFISKVFGSSASRYLSGYGGEYFPFVLVGISFSEYISLGLTAFSTSIRQEQLSGTLESVFSAPLSVVTCFLGYFLYPLLFTTLNTVLCLFSAAVFLNVDLSNVNIASVLLVLSLGVICFSSFGIISSSFILLFKRGDPVNWLISGFFIFMGGVYFPVKVLPSFLQKVSFVLPVTYFFEGLRLAILKNYSPGMLSFPVFVLFLSSLILFPVSILFLRFSLNKVKESGGLFFY